MLVNGSFGSKDDRSLGSRIGPRPAPHAVEWVGWKSIVPCRAEGQMVTVVDRIADCLDAQPKRGLLVGVDGVDGVGKTTFADELGDALRARGREVVRSSADGFHHPRSVRYRLGRSSPEGFYRDSYNYPPSSTRAAAAAVGAGLAALPVRRFRSCNG